MGMKNSIIVELMMRLKKEREEMRKKILKVKKLVSVVALWEVVKKTQKATNNQITKCYN